MGSAPTMPLPAEQPQLSQPQRILNLFFDPVKTFTDLKRGTAWWMAFLVVTVVSYLMVAAVATKVGFEQVSENQMKLQPKQMERLEQMPPDQRAKAMAFGVTITKVISYGYPVFYLIGSALAAVVLMGIFNFAAGADVTFGRSLAVVIYSSLVGAVKAVLVAITLFAGVDPEGFTFDNPLASNLGYFIDMNAHPALHRFATSMDVFTIWYVVLLGVGYSCVSRVKRATGIGIVGGIWLAWVLVATLLKAVF